MNEMNDAKIRIEEHCGRKRIVIVQKSRMSWRRHNTDGTAEYEATEEFDGSVNFHLTEMPDDYKGTKEVFVTLPSQAVDALMAMLSERRRKP